MNKLTMSFFAMLAATVALIAAPSVGMAQSKAEKKYVVRILSIEEGDTTITDHAVEPGDDDFVWVDDDGNHVTAFFEGDDDDADMKEDMTVEVLGEKKYNEYVLSGKKGGKNKFVVKKMGGAAHAGMEGCGAGSCCKMGDKDMKEMHDAHGSTEKHNMMQKHHGDDDDDDDDEADDKDDEKESDDDDDNLF